MVVFGESCCNGQKWMNSGKVVVFGQIGCIRAKVIVFVRNFFYSGKVVVIGQKWL